MGIFNSIFKKVSESAPNNVHWVPLNTLEQLDAIKEQSKSEVILIFKHSTRCGISRMVKQRFEGSFDESMSSIKVYYLDLLNFRDLSDEVERVFQISHQSPQLLIIKNQVAILNASHHDITTVTIKKYL